MQSKLCLVLALAVLVGALAGGNPFLDRGAAVPLRGVPTAAEAVPANAPHAQTVGFEPSRTAGVVPATFGRHSPAPICPEPGLHAHVVAVRYDVSGQPVWVLDDGRSVRQNPRSGPGQPKVIVIGGGSGPGGDAEDEAEGR